MWLKIFLSIWLICLFSLKSKGQILTYQFIDPCTKQITFFSVPATGTTIFFLGQSRQFTSNDVINGTFGTWINQVYTDYRKVTPCSQQSGQVTQNQIISQAISGTVQSVVGSIMSQAQSASSSTMSSMGGGTDAASKGSNTSSDNKPKNENKNANNTVRNNTSIPSNTQNNTSSNSGNNNNNNSSSSNNNSGSNDNNSTTSKSNTQTSKKEEEVAAAIIMNNDTRQEKEEESSSSSDNKNNKRGKSSNSRSNPIIVQSDLTTAQNLDRSFTPILNLGLSRSSMTGASSWGITSMTWLNFKQFALSGRYTKIHFSKSGTLKFIHNFNLTGVYTYGNVLAFMGYSGILNAGKWGVTGFNVSAAGTLIAEEDNTYLSPSFTAFYTKPFKVNNRLTVSPEIYIISTPLIYSSKEQITTTDRTFSGFLGSGFDYQITKRFKFNINYKANLSTNSEFPILSFLLIGSKINL